MSRNIVAALLALELVFRPAMTWAGPNDYLSQSRVWDRERDATSIRRNQEARASQQASDRSNASHTSNVFGAFTNTIQQAQERQRQAGQADLPPPKTVLETVSEAAQAGDRDAMRALAGGYATGTQVEKDLGKSMQWFAKAADAGDVFSQSYLGWSLLLGTNVVKNEVRGLDYLQRAVA